MIYSYLALLRCFPCSLRFKATSPRLLEYSVRREIDNTLGLVNSHIN